jgi:UDP:flavonoid glycosyltransferase YjiC (YdhE family)
MASYGLEPINKTDDLHVGDLTLIAGTPETDPLALGTDAVYVGPILYQNPDAKLPDSITSLDTEKPVLWVYTATPRYFEPFITMGDSAVVMKACIEAFANKDVQVVLTTGYRDLPSDSTSFPANFIYETFVPGLLMAERSDAIVHHGGHGASLTGPYTGTPAVIIPTFSERESNARRIANLGAAELIVPTEDEELEKHVSVEEVWTKVKQVLSDPSYTESARLLGEKMRSYGGVAEAVRLIESFSEQVS